MICNMTSTCVVNTKGERKKKYKILNQDKRQFVLRFAQSHAYPMGNVIGLLARQDHFWIQFNNSKFQW
jgi:hypothetical protein